MNKVIFISEIHALKKEPMSLLTMQKFMLLVDGLISVTENELNEARAQDYLNETHWPVEEYDYD